MTNNSKVSVRKSTLAAARKHIIAQGEVSYAANLLQDAFYELFCIALSLERPDQIGAEFRFHSHALAIWHVVQNDNQQREMAVVTLSTVPTSLSLSKGVSCLTWAKKMTSRLAEYRNLVVHAPIMFRGRQKGTKIQMLPAFGAYSTRPLQMKRLSLIGSLRFWQTIRNDFLALREYVAAVNQQVRRIEFERLGAKMVGVPNTWPRKPRLRSLPHLQAIEQKLAPITQKSARPNTRRPARS